MFAAVGHAGYAEKHTHATEVIVILIKNLRLI
jgi:hypothetical protein